MNCFCLLLENTENLGKVYSDFSNLKSNVVPGPTTNNERIDSAEVSSSSYVNQYQQSLLKWKDVAVLVSTEPEPVFTLVSK